MEDQELKQYRERIEQHLFGRRAVSRHDGSGRRESDYKPPRFWDGLILPLTILSIAAILLGLGV